MRVDLLDNVRAVSHDSAPNLPMPAVLFMSVAGENGRGSGGVAFSEWD